MAEEFDFYGFDPTWDQPIEDVWKRSLYQGLGGTDFGPYAAAAKSSLGHPYIERMSTQGLAPAYASFLLGEQPSFASYLSNPTGLTGGSPLINPAGVGWGTALALSRARANELTNPATWETASTLLPQAMGGATLAPLWAGEGGLDPDQARAMAFARMVPAGTSPMGYGMGIRGNLAQRAIANLQNAYERVQMMEAGTPGATGTLAGKTVAPSGQGGFLSWLAQAMPDRFGYTGTDQEILDILV